MIAALEICRQSLRMPPVIGEICRVLPERSSRMLLGSALPRASRVRKRPGNFATHNCA